MPLRVSQSVNNVEILDLCRRLLRIEQSHRIRIGLTLKDLNLSITKLRETPSNAFSKSIKKIRTSCLLSMAKTNGAPCLLKLVW